MRDTRTSQLFTGKEADQENLLYYFGARYYDQELGRFVSIDPFGQRLAELNDEKLKAFLADPQRLNSYGYASNNPIVNKDVDGGLTIKAFNHPQAVAAQLGFWHSGVNGYLKPQGLNATASLLQHSLGWYPKDIKITSANQSKYGNIIEQIKDSGEYKSIISSQVNQAIKDGRNSFSIWQVPHILDT